MIAKTEIKKLLDFGSTIDATHLIIFFEPRDGATISKYVKPGQSVQEVVNSVIKFGSKYRVQAIYNYDLDLEEQLNELKPNHFEPSKKYKTNYEKALEYATKKHEGQKRDGIVPEPYINHPIRVANLVEKYMKKNEKMEDYKTAAILHDTLEDTDATYEEEVELVGEDIANIVLNLTNDRNKIEEVGKAVYLADKMVNMDDNTLVVKLCDRYDNVCGLTYVDDDFNEKYIDDTIYMMNYLLIYRHLNKTHLKIVNKIMKKVEEVSRKKPLLNEPKKKVLKKPTE